MIAKAAIEEFLSRPRDNYDWLKELSRLELQALIEERAPYYRFKTKPRLNQMQAFIICTYRKRFMFHTDMGGGKTKITLDALSYWKQVQHIRKKILIVVPKAQHYGTWMTQAKEHSYLTAEPLIGNREERFRIAETSTADILLITYESLRAMLSRPRITPEAKEKYVSLVKRQKAGEELKKSERKFIEHIDDMSKGKVLEVDKRTAEDFASLFDAIACDEIHNCFWKNTSIATPTGFTDIDKVRDGDTVLTVTGTATVKTTFKNKVKLSDVIKVVLNNGKTIFCSKEHLFLTLDGWVPAISLANKLTLSYSIYGDMGHILPRIGELNETCSYWSDTSTRCKVLSDMWNKILRCVAQTKPQVLWHKLFSYVAHEATRGDSETNFQRMGRCDKSSPNKTKVRKTRSMEETVPRPVNSDATEKPLKESFIYCQSKRYQTIKGDFTYLVRKTWRQWNWPYSATTIVSNCIGLENGSSSSDVDSRYSSRLPDLLQDRCGEPTIEARYRSRRNESQIEESFISRCKEDKEARTVGVESVEIYQQGNNDESFSGVIGDKERNQGFVEFYDLEVEGHPSYYANGVLVHNCKNKKTLNYDTLKAVSVFCHVRYGLTGTPFGRHSEDLWPQFDIIDDGDTLGRTITLFRESFFTVKQNFFGGWDYVLDKKQYAKLHKQIKHRSLSHESHELGDLPPQNFNTIYFSLPEAQRKYYDKMADAVREDAKSGVRARVEGSFMKLRMVASGFLWFDSDCDPTDDSGKKEKIRNEIVFDDNPKLDELIEMLENLTVNNKVVVFNEFTRSGDFICERLKKLKIKHIRLYGGTPAKEKMTVEQRFKEDDDIRVIVSNSKSGAEGLNLQSANYTIYYESPVSPIVRRQSEKRTHRDGQTKPVFYYDFVVSDTVEERILTFLKEGKDMFQALIAGKIKI